MRKVNALWTLIPALLLPMAVGMASAALSRNGIQLYKTMAKPFLAPPAVVFPVAWSVLYLMMGTASFFMFTTKTAGGNKSTAVILYLVQLAMNFFWTIIFFNLRMYTAAFVWLLIMYIIIIACTTLFFLIRPLAGWLMVPYNIWMAFAAYLNLSIVIMKP